MGKQYKVNKTRINENPASTENVTTVGKGHRAVGCWPRKKEKEDDVNNLFVGVTICVEVLESDDKKDIEKWLGDIDASFHITYTKKRMTNIE